MILIVTAITSSEIKHFFIQWLQQKRLFQKKIRKNILTTAARSYRVESEEANALE
jgi:hypothetical protein